MIIAEKLEGSAVGDLIAPFGSPCSQVKEARNMPLLKGVG